MQKLNKSVFKAKLVYTWYFYPIAIGVASLIWIASFKAIHQPNFHEKVTMFIGAEVKDVSFTSKIQTKFKDQNLRELEVPYCASSSSVYGSKLNLFLSNSDLLILEQSTLDTFAKDKEGGSAEFFKEYFVPFNEYVKTNYLKSTSMYFSLNDPKQAKDIDYGVLINAKNSSSYLSSYVNFLPDQNYYMLMSITSKNLGPILDENNKDFTNALDVMKYIVYGGEV